MMRLAKPHSPANRRLPARFARTDYGAGNVTTDTLRQPGEKLAGCTACIDMTPLSAREMNDQMISSMLRSARSNDRSVVRRKDASCFLRSMCLRIPPQSTMQDATRPRCRIEPWRSSY